MKSTALDPRRCIYFNSSCIALGMHGVLSCRFTERSKVHRGIILLLLPRESDDEDEQVLHDKLRDVENVQAILDKIKCARFQRVSHLILGEDDNNVAVVFK